MNDGVKIVGVGVGCFIIILFVALGPFLFLWGVNTLIAGAGGTAIALTFKTWLAAFILTCFFLGGSSSSK